MTYHTIKITWENGRGSWTKNVTEETMQSVINNGGYDEYEARILRAANEAHGTELPMCYRGRKGTARMVARRHGADDLANQIEEDWVFVA